MDKEEKFKWFKSGWIMAKSIVYLEGFLSASKNRCIEEFKLINEMVSEKK